MTDNERYPLVVYRKKGPPWPFVWDEERRGYFYQGRKHTYRLFFPEGGMCTKIWIGLLYKNAWITWEREIGATSIDFEDGYYRFK